MVKYKDYVNKEKIDISIREINDFKYRYSISLPIINNEYRTGDKLLVCSMNPSKSNKDFSDSTLNKLCKFAYENNYRSLTVVAVLPFYETNSKDLNKFSNEEFKNILQENLNEIKKEFQIADNIIIATGNPTNKKMENIILDLKAIIKNTNKDNFFCFQGNDGNPLTKTGNTFHPLYLKGLNIFKLPKEYFN